MSTKSSSKSRNPPRNRPVSPPHLAKPEADLWNSIVTEFTFEDPASLALLASALESHGRARRCRDSIDKVGELVRDRFGQAKPHPLLAAERDARSAFLTAMRLLNLDIAGSGS